MSATTTIQGTSAGSRVWLLVFVSCFLGLLVDGADFMFLSYSLSSLAKEFELSAIQTGSLASITLLGMAVGGVFGGWCSDKFGRVRTIAWTIVIFSVGTCALAFSQNYHQFAAMRFISAVGLGAEYVVCNTLMAEYVPTRWRNTVLGVLQAGWSVGYVIATLLAGWILPEFGWRWLFFISIAPVFLAIVVRHFIPESPAWLAARQTAKSAMRVTLKENALLYILRNPQHRKIFLLWILTGCALQFGYFGVNTWFPSYIEKELGFAFRSMTFFMVGTYVAMIFGKVAAGWCSDRFGRRVVFAFGAIGSALFLPVIIYGNTPDNILYLMIVFGFLYGIPYGVNATYMTESFETQIRGSAVGAAYNIGRLGAAMAPVAIGWFASSGGIGFGLLAMGIAYFIAGVIPALFIREKLYDPQKN